MEDRGGETSERPPPGHVRFVVTFDAPAHPGEWVWRVKKFLKAALRGFGLTCKTIDVRCPNAP